MRLPMTIASFISAIAAVLLIATWPERSGSGGARLNSDNYRI